MLQRLVNHPSTLSSEEDESEEESELSSEALPPSSEKVNPDCSILFLTPSLSMYPGKLSKASPWIESLSNVRSS